MFPYRIFVNVQLPCWITRGHQLQRCIPCGTGGISVLSCRCLAWTWWSTFLREASPVWWWYPQCEAPKISKLVYNSNNYGLWFMVLVTIATGAYKPTYNWGASHCKVTMVVSILRSSVFMTTGWWYRGTPWLFGNLHVFTKSQVTFPRLYPEFRGHAGHAHLTINRTKNKYSHHLSSCGTSYPIGSMYAIYGNIYH